MSILQGSPLHPRESLNPHQPHPQPPNPLHGFSAFSPYPNNPGFNHPMFPYATKSIYPPPPSVNGEDLYPSPPVGQGLGESKMVTDEGSLSPDAGQEGPYKCTSCDKTFNVPARLQRHLRTHTGEKPFKCEYCNKTFSVKENLNVHRRIHTKERPFSCNICGRAFEHSGKLHRHMRTHTGERPHKCEVCGKTFVQSGQLVIHMRAHTGEKPYSCSYCTKAFTCSKQLKVHIRTHTGEKPYACDICGKTFGYNHVLKMHKMSHMGKRLYKCTLCDQFFSSRKALDLHIREHSDEVDGVTPPDNDSVISDLNGGDKTAPKTKRKYKPRKQTSVASSMDSSSPNSSTPSSPLSKSDEYYSDDSGCGNSSLSPSPPVSPEQRSPNSSPVLQICEPSVYPDQEPSLNGLSESSNTFSSQQRLHDRSSLDNRYPDLEIKAEPEEHSSLSIRKDLHVQPRDQPMVSSANDLQFSSKSSSQIKLKSISDVEEQLLNGTKVAILTTQSGEKLTCPINVLMKLRSKEVAYCQIKNELSLRLAREEAKRQKEQKFFTSVIVVLESLIGRERMQQFGHPDHHIDLVIRNALNFMKSQPCTEPSLSAMDRVKVNLRLLLEICVPDQAMWDHFGWRGKPIEDIVSEFMEQCGTQARVQEIQKIRYY